MSDYLRHTTAIGDRWDLLAERYYGDSLRYEPILRANPALAPLAVLPAGTEIVVPILEEDEPTLAALPPWRV